MKSNQEQRARAALALTRIECGDPNLQPLQRAQVDQTAYNDAAMRVNASRWAAMPVLAPKAGARSPSIVTVAGQPREMCVLLVDAKHDEKSPLARRCTYSIVRAGSASLNREGTALALAVQPLEAWRELWLFRKNDRGGWNISVLPPATTNPDLG